MRTSLSIHIGLYLFVAVIVMLVGGVAHAEVDCSKFGTDMESDIPQKKLPECRLEYRILQLHGELPICAPAKKYRYELESIYCRVFMRGEDWGKRAGIQSHDTGRGSQGEGRAINRSNEIQRKRLESWKKFNKPSTPGSRSVGRRKREQYIRERQTLRSKEGMAKRPDYISGRAKRRQEQKDFVTEVKESLRASGKLAEIKELKTDERLSLKKRLLECKTPDATRKEMRACIRMKFQQNRTERFLR